MIENVSTQLTVFHGLCPLPASRKGLRLPLRSALFGEGGRDWRPCPYDVQVANAEIYNLTKVSSVPINILYRLSFNIARRHSVQSDLTLTNIDNC